MQQDTRSNDFALVSLTGAAASGAALTSDTLWRLASWHGGLSMCHYAFAFYVAIETSRAENAFSPGVQLTYNQWVLADPSKDSCDDTVCVVYAVATTYGNINLGFVAAAFSWISGTHHAAVYLWSYGLKWPGRDWVCLRRGRRMAEGCLRGCGAQVLTQMGFLAWGQANGKTVYTGNAIRAIDYACSAPLMLAAVLLLFEGPGSVSTLAAYYAAMALVVGCCFHPGF